MDIRYLGHSTFELSDGTRACSSIRSWRRTTPRRRSAQMTSTRPTSCSRTRTSTTSPTPRRSPGGRAPTVALVETAGRLGSKGVENVSDPNLGGTVTFDWGWVKLVQALHSSTTPDGTVTYASGLVINIGGTTVYHLGDTCLFSDLKLIAERTPVDIALIPIGGHYTMDRHDAVVAAELIGAGTVIPCHYNTFPPIETDAQAFKADVESKTARRWS